MKIGLGILSLVAMTASAPHVLADHRVTSTIYELHAFTDVDGQRKVDKKITEKPFYKLEDCIKEATKLEAPPSAREYYGHTIVYGYTCVQVDAPAMETKR